MFFTFLPPIFISSGKNIIDRIITENPIYLSKIRIEIEVRARIVFLTTLNLNHVKMQNYQTFFTSFNICSNKFKRQEPSREFFLGIYCFFWSWLKKGRFPNPIGLKTTCRLLFVMNT